jgi:hypothetical protein
MIKFEFFFFFEIYDFLLRAQQILSGHRSIKHIFICKLNIL